MYIKTAFTHKIIKTKIKEVKIKIFIIIIVKKNTKIMFFQQPQKDK